MKRVSSRRLQRIACHDAGHAVIALRARMPFKYVTIIPHGNAAGHLMGDLSAWIPKPDVDEQRKVTSWIERRIEVLLAGHAAEAHFTGRNNWVCSSHDHDSAFGLASLIYHGNDWIDFVSDKAGDVHALIASPAV